MEKPEESVYSSVGMDITKQILNTGENYVSKNLSFSIFRPYFHVSTDKIFNKLKFILCPFLKAEYSIELYIPLLSFFTFNYLNTITFKKSDVNVAYDLNNYFSKSIALEIIILCVIKAIAFWLDIKIKILDLVSISGYKYFPVCLNALIRRIFVSVYLFGALFVFLTKLVKNSVIRSRNKKEVYFLFIFVIVESLSFLMFIFWNS